MSESQENIAYVRTTLLSLRRRILARIFVVHCLPGRALKAYSPGQSSIMITQVYQDIAETSS
jgi:hypothetical protein